MATICYLYGLNFCQQITGVRGLSYTEKTDNRANAPNSKNVLNMYVLICLMNNLRGTSAKKLSI